MLMNKIFYNPIYTEKQITGDRLNGCENTREAALNALWGYMSRRI